MPHYTPGAEVCGRDLLFDNPHLADWYVIGQCRQKLVDKMNTRENVKRLPHEKAVGETVMLKVDDVKRKAVYKYTSTYTITQVHTNGTV